MVQELLLCLDEMNKKLQNFKDAVKVAVLTHELTCNHTHTYFVIILYRQCRKCTTEKSLGNKRRCYVIRSYSKSSEHSVMLNYDVTFFQLLL